MSRRRERAALAARLRALGSRTPAPPDPARVAATEARLRAIFDAHGGQAPEPVAIVDDAAVDALRGVGSRRRRVAVSAVVFVAAAGAIAAFALLVGDPARDRDRDFRLTAAENAYVVLADGSRIPAIPGITIPAGGRLEVGAGGSATIDGHTLGPGESATLDDGELAVTPSQGDTGPGDSGAGGTGSGSSGDTPDPTGSASTTPSGPSATTTPVADTSTSATTRPPATTTTTRPPATTSTTSPAPVVQPLRARAVLDGTVVHLTWQQYEGSDFAAYLVVARTDGLAPLPGRDGNVVLFRSDGRRVTARDIRMRDDLAVRIVVVDAKGRIVAASKVMRPGTDPRTGTATTTTTTTSTSATTSATTSTTSSTAPVTTTTTTTTTATGT